MKLGTKPDSFQSDEDCIRYSKMSIFHCLLNLNFFQLLTRYVASDLATYVVVNVVDVKFYLHKVQFKKPNHCCVVLGAVTTIL